MSALESVPDPARAQIAEQTQQQIYNHAAGAIWRHAVYDVLHAGWDLACIAGLAFLDDIMRRSRLQAGSRLLDLGCGGGAACHYLSQRSGCSAVGVERNPAQLQRAGARAERLPAGRLQFLAGDVGGEVLLDGNFDAVMQLDTFSLLASVHPAIATARRLTAPTGYFYMADLVAGPRFDAKTREYAWEVDGFSSLIPTDELQEQLETAGFGQIEKHDRTDDACEANRRILEWLSHPPEPLPEGISADQIRDWASSTSWYYAKFAERALGYYWWRMAPGR